MPKKRSKKHSLKNSKRLKIFFHLSLFISFSIIVLAQYGVLQKSELLTISKVVKLSDDVKKFQFTICPHQYQRIKNDSMSELGPGIGKQMERLEYNENSTYGDIMDLVKPPEQFMKYIGFGFTSTM